MPKPPWLPTLTTARLLRNMVGHRGGYYIFCAGPQFSEEPPFLDALLGEDRFDEFVIFGHQPDVTL